MDSLHIKSFGPISKADITFGDLTILVGPQASGKSIFLQLLKLVIDKKHIRRTLEQYSIGWGEDTDATLDLYFGEGMHHVWNDKTSVHFGSQQIDKEFLKFKRKEMYKNAEEKLYYIPAQRILSIADGRPKFFTEFDETVPYVLRYFSESLRQLMQSGMGKQESVFPQNQRLKLPLRNAINASIFHDSTIVVDNTTAQKKFKMKVGKSNIPFMAWSAGQKEFMPLLLGFYWLCPPSRVTTRDKIKYVIIEEPEMGLHPQAIKSVLLQVVDLLSRDYKVIISTHSPLLLEFAWAFNYLKKYKANENALFELFDIEKSAPTVRLFKDIVKNKNINTYFFDNSAGKVIVKDVSALDAGSEDTAMAEWGGLTSFASRASEIVSKIVSL